MALPLQPDLTPPPRWPRSLAIIAAAMLAIAIAGSIASPANRAAQVLHTGPRPAYLHAAERLIDNAGERIWLMDFVMHLGDDDDPSHPVQHLCHRLAAAHARGVDVRVVIDIGKEWGTDRISPKHERAHAFLSKLGVPVFLDEIDRTSHSKVLLIDDHSAIVGSHNWTRSAMLRNRETSVLLHDPVCITDLETLFTDLPNFNPPPTHQPRQ
ncbi:MAG: phospholipase D-like domain-containing protein [Planctomycetota bacterium]|jgi:phosphatidylserine/phosphatidylglycerophosphate/cardiolipin synthase-like enzyme